MTPIVRIQGRNTAPVYMRQIVRPYIIPLMNNFIDDGDARIFMQDNAPQHSAADTMALLSRQRFEMLDWPPRSPDLNPIENVWAEMEIEWPHNHPRNDENLHAAVVARWIAVGQNQREHFFKNSNES